MIRVLTMCLSVVVIVTISGCVDVDDIVVYSDDPIEESGEYPVKVTFNYRGTMVEEDVLIKVLIDDQQIPYVLININTADLVELCTLPGIGPVKAGAIIENRYYFVIQDLLRVPGIGPITLNNIAHMVTCGDTSGYPQPDTPRRKGSDEDMVEI